jgi:hypothetical protein
MKTIIVMCDPNRIDAHLISSLQELFPECEIRIVFSEKGDVEVYPIAVNLKKDFI